MRDLIGSRGFWDGVAPNQELVALELTRQALVALGTLHSAGHIHSDLHLKNIAIHHSSFRTWRKSHGYILNIIDFGRCLPAGSEFGMLRPPACMAQHPPELMGTCYSLHPSGPPDLSTASQPE